MAGELKHITKGTSLTQAEFEHIDLHACNNQATGDLIYASSATQLSRLAVGAVDTIFTSNGTTPSWSTTPILNTAVAKGTWTASGTWTIPAVTLGGAVSGGAQTITNLGTVLIGSATAYESTYLPRIEINNSTNTNGGLALHNWDNQTRESFLFFDKSLSDTIGTFTAVSSGLPLGQIAWRGADGTDWQWAVQFKAYSTGTIGADRVPGRVDIACWSDIAASAGLVTLSMKADNFLVNTSNAAQTAAVARLSISGAAATAVATWTNITHAGMVMSDHLTLYITDTDGATEGDIWYDASEDKLKFKTAAGVETVTSG